MPKTRSRPRSAARRGPNAAARPSNRGGAGRPGTRSPVPTGRRRLGRGAVVAAVLAAAAVVLLVVLLVVLMALRPWEGEAPSADGFDVDPARVAELEAAEAERAVENLSAAGELAVSAQERLLPVMDGLYETLPVAEAGEGDAEGEPTSDVAPPPTSAELDEWRAVVDEVATEMEALPTGSSEHNIVRNGLILSTRLLGDTLDVLELAAADDAENESADDSALLYGVAGDLRTRAVDAWAVAAVQLDLQHIEADRGHLHAFLPLHSGMSAEGEAEMPHGDH